MDPREMYYSNHWTKERAARRDEIDFALNSNWGIIAYKAWNPDRNNWQFMTTTGLLFVMDECELFIVTMMIPSKSQFFRFFQMAGQEPLDWFIRQAKRNSRRAREWRENFSEKVA